MRVENGYITGRGRQKDGVRGGDLLCYWTVAKLGMSMVDPARKCDMTRERNRVRPTHCTN
jgi:hypothetical protein